MDNLQNEKTSLPTYVKLIIGILIVLVISLLIYLLLMKSNNKIVYDERYIIENDSLRKELKIRKEESEKAMKYVDSVTKLYDSRNIDEELSNLNKHYENEKIRINTIPIDSTVRNLSRWVSENTSDK